MTEADAILITAGVATAGATAGWIYTARWHRLNSRKGHTFNAILQATSSIEYRNAFGKIAPLLAQKRKITKNQYNKPDIKDALRFLLNYYEVLAAGIRIGDIDEKLLIYTEKGLILKLLDQADLYIQSLITTRDRATIYEHLEWLHKRWKTPLGWWQRLWEWIRLKPIEGQLRE